MDTIVQTKPQSLVAKFGERFGVDPSKLMSTLKKTAFRVKDGEATDEQMMALMIVADQYGLNPFTKEIYAYPDKQNGIVPVVGVDGWSRIINQSQDMDGLEFRQSENMVTLEGAKSCPEWMECAIYRKDRAHPTIIREYLDEVYRAPFTTKDGRLVSGPWQTHTKRFLRHKSLIQCSRIALGFVGIYDQDEAERIVQGEHEIVREQVGKPEVKMPVAKKKEPAPSSEETHKAAVDDFFKEAREGFAEENVDVTQ